MVNDIVFSLQFPDKSLILRVSGALSVAVKRPARLGDHSANLVARLRMDPYLHSSIRFNGAVLSSVQAVSSQCGIWSSTRKNLPP